MRFFNTEGPVNCTDHYCLLPLSRLDLEDVLALIAQNINRPRPACAIILRRID